MLEDLTIKDFALIESLALEFGPRFNVLSGETGAGKSILIGALTFLLGGKAGSDVIRTGCEEARVSGTVWLTDTCQAARRWLSEHGISADNERVLLRRVVRQNGKTLTAIQDTPVTRVEMADFTSLVFDIHGQHEHQSLLRVSEHRRFLDAYAGILPDVAAFTALYTALAEKRRLRDELDTSEKECAERMELLRFGIQEIEDARLVPGEDDELTAEEQRLSQYEKLFASADQAVLLLSPHEGILASFKKLRQLCEHISKIDTGIGPIASRLENVWYEFDDIAESLRQYHSSLAFDPGRLEAVQERLGLLFRLKKKYGETIPAMLQWRDQALVQLESLANRETSRERLDAQIAELEQKAWQAGSLLSTRRAASASALETSVEAIVRDLGMKGTRFAVTINVRACDGQMQQSAPWGFDDIEFMISANPGEPLRPLAKIASGGEISRVMLALKTVLADADETSALVFDEIDTGIGGEVALSVGAHLHRLASSKQIFCITHLASIAVRADNHIRIEKQSTGSRTATHAATIDGAARTAEIARMLSGDGDSAASLQHAEDLLRKYGSMP